MRTKFCRYACTAPSFTGFFAFYSRISSRPVFFSSKLAIVLLYSGFVFDGRADPGRMLHLFPCSSVAYPAAEADALNYSGVYRSSSSYSLFAPPLLIASVRSIVEGVLGFLAEVLLGPMLVEALFTCISYSYTSCSKSNSLTFGSLFFPLPN